MRVMITGGLGFIGANLVAYLLRNTSWDITIIDVGTYAAHFKTKAMLERLGAASMGSVRIIKGDINDTPMMLDVLRANKIEAIMHLAAETHVDRSIDGPSVFLQTNVMGTGSILQAALQYWQALPSECARKFCFIHISTDEVFGSLKDTGAFSETSPYRPNSPYAASKAASDHLVRAWGKTYGLPFIIANCSNNFGPFQFPEKLIALSIVNAITNQPIAIYGDGQNIRDWLYVDDHANALKTLCEEGRSGNYYCIGANQERTNVQVVTSICDILQEMLPQKQPYHDLIAFTHDRPGHDERYAIDATKLTNETSWYPRMDFEQGLRLTIAWYLQNRPWWQYLRDHVYDAGRLGQLRS